MKFLAFLGVVSQGLQLQFVQFMGYAGLAAAIASGWFRAPSWIVPIVGIVLAVAANYLSDLTDLKTLLHNYHDEEKGAGGFLVIVYVFIAVVGYIVGAYGRSAVDERKASGAPQKK